MNEFKVVGVDCVYQRWHCLQALQFLRKRAACLCCEPQAIGQNYQELHSRTTTTKSPSVCTTIFSTSLQILRFYYLSHVTAATTYADRILAPPLLWREKHTDQRAHSPKLWHQSRRANFTWAWSWTFCGINPGISVLRESPDHEDGTRIFRHFGHFIKNIKEFHSLSQDYFL